MTSTPGEPSHLRLLVAKILASGRANIVLAIGLIVLIANAVAAFEAARVLIEYEKESQLALERLVSLEEVLSSVRDVETGARGFVITGHASYLEPYRNARERMNTEIGQLNNLFGNDPAQQPHLRNLIPHIEAKLAHEEALIRVRMEGGFNEGRDLVQTGHGRTLMDSIRIAVRDMRELEDGNFQKLSMEADKHGTRTRVTLAVFTVVSLLLLSSVHFLAKRDLEKREQLAQLLQAANETLEVRVLERTSELEQANERLRGEVDERQRAEEQLRAVNTELVRSNRELEDFAYVASHDLQEPLRKIQTFASMLDMEYGRLLDDEGHRYLNRLSESANRMSRLIADLLSFSRVTTKVKPFEPTDLNEVVKTVLADLEIAILDSKVDLQIADLPTIEADESQMQQLFQNLIGNALKFRHPDRAPRIAIGASVSRGGQPDAECVLTFTDNGIGFEEKYLDRIFTPFQRLHNRDEYEGTGIGLSICRRIVERHGGTITARSIPGEGSSFIVILPVYQPRAAESASVSA